VSRAAFAAALVILGSMALAAVALSGGVAAAVATPVIAAVVVLVVWRAPFTISALGLMFLSLISDAPQDSPMADLWRSPLYWLGAVLCNNWSKSFGISALPFSGTDVLCVLLLGRVALRRLAGRAPPMADAIWKAMAVFLAAIAALTLLGAAGGGDLGVAYWQVRQLVYIPVFVLLLAEALPGPEDQRLLAPLIVVAALIKAADGLFFYFAIARSMEISPPYITSHTDTMLFCLSLTLLAIRWLDNPDPKSLRRCLWLIPPLLAAIWLNNRRIAYVALVATFAVVWMFTQRNAARRFLARGLLAAAPLLAAYAAMGWETDALVFKPVASIRTVMEAEKDSSTRSREIENFNLSRTLRMHPLGMGLGRPYEEVEKGPDISGAFALWRHIPHNSVLWMMAAGGPLGFPLLWAPFLVGMYLAARSHRFARTPLERMSALGAMCSLLLFLIQAYGDMGTQNWSTTWLVAAALAVAGRSAVANGAWPFAPQWEPA
jgi:hypothetical protein